MTGVVLCCINRLVADLVPRVSLLPLSVVGPVDFIGDVVVVVLRGKAYGNVVVVVLFGKADVDVAVRLIPAAIVFGVVGNAMIADVGTGIVVDFLGVCVVIAAALLTSITVVFVAPGGAASVPVVVVVPGGAAGVPVAAVGPGGTVGVPVVVVVPDGAAGVPVVPVVVVVVVVVAAPDDKWMVSIVDLVIKEVSGVVIVTLNPSIVCSSMLQ